MCYPNNALLGNLYTYIPHQLFELFIKVVMMRHSFPQTLSYLNYE